MPTRKQRGQAAEQRRKQRQQRNNATENDNSKRDETDSMSSTEGITRSNTSRTRSDRAMDTSDDHVFCIMEESLRSAVKLEFVLNSNAKEQSQVSDWLQSRVLALENSDILVAKQMIQKSYTAQLLWYNAKVPESRSIMLGDYDKLQKCIDTAVKLGFLEDWTYRSDLVNALRAHVRAQDASVSAMAEVAAATVCATNFVIVPFLVPSLSNYVEIIQLWKQMIFNLTTYSQKLASENKHQEAANVREFYEFHEEKLFHPRNSCLTRVLVWRAKQNGFVVYESSHSIFNQSERAFAVLLGIDDTCECLICLSDPTFRWVHTSPPMPCRNVCQTYKEFAGRQTGIAVRQVGGNVLDFRCRFCFRVICSSPECRRYFVSQGRDGSASCPACGHQDAFLFCKKCYKPVAKSLDGKRIACADCVL